jgi:DNA invertase Pin-like site-specific DNA recombinase
MNYDIVGTFTEKVSGAKKTDERPELLKVMDLVKKGEIQKILVWDFTRFSRDSFDCYELIKILNDNCVSLFVFKDNFETPDRDCKLTSQGEIFLSFLVSFARTERDKIRERMSSGYIAHLNKGGKVGRKLGYEKDIQKTKKFNEISSLLKSGMSIRGVMSLLDVSQITVYKVKKHLEEKGQLTNLIKQRMKWTQE